jgi:hypothetical protein
VVSTAQTDPRFTITSANIQIPKNSELDYPSLLKGRREDQDQEMLLFANENQNARCQRQDSHYDCRDGDVEQQSDSGENKVDSEEQHSEVLGDVHAAFLRQRQRVCTL